MHGYVNLSYTMCASPCDSALFLIGMGAEFATDCLVKCGQRNQDNSRAYVSAALPGKQSSCRKAMGNEAVMNIHYLVCK